MTRIPHDMFFRIEIPCSTLRIIVSPREDLDVTEDTWNSLNWSSQLNMIYRYAHDKYKLTLEDQKND